MSFRRTLKTGGLYVSSWLHWRAKARVFQQVRTYLMFVGYPRSGHSLIASLLDAHPNIIVAHELHALRLIEAGFSKEQLFYLLLQNSRLMATMGRRHSGYSYAVPNQWQGRFASLQVIGDKKGAASATCLRRNPGLFETFKTVVNTEIKFIHVIRNPYDVLTTMKSRRPHKDFDVHLNVFFELCETIEELKCKVAPERMFELKLEAFIAEPKLHLEGLCSFVKVGNAPGYLDDCSSIVFTSPKKSRHDLPWSQDAIAVVGERMSRFGFLSGYSFCE